ncbi:hypothetical protein ACSCB1_35445 [Streptomyces europaeiscabiei]|uniref:hypothetical protein n=1 Tax=Streptomyces europaeiscabiei TaxID=146819 RepID=UPI000A830289|nr:hypothetical protein [Streptomyces europaeiscabiei]
MASDQDNREIKELGNRVSDLRDTVVKVQTTIDEGVKPNISQLSHSITSLQSSIDSLSRGFVPLAVHEKNVKEVEVRFNVVEGRIKELEEFKSASEPSVNFVNQFLSKWQGVAVSTLVAVIIWFLVFKGKVPGA